MSKEKDLHKIICKMHTRLNEIIEENDFDLLCDEVLSYSKQLDKVIGIYLRREKPYHLF